MVSRVLVDIGAWRMVRGVTHCKNVDSHSVGVRTRLMFRIAASTLTTNNLTGGDERIRPSILHGDSILYRRRFTKPAESGGRWSLGPVARGL